MPTYPVFEVGRDRLPDGVVALDGRVEFGSDVAHFVQAVGRDAWKVVVLAVQRQAEAHEVHHRGVVAH